MTDPHDQCVIDALRRDVTLYRWLFRDTWALTTARICLLERQLSDTREELARITRERVA